MGSLKDSISKMAINSLCFQQGESLMYQGEVTDLITKTFWKSEVEMKATVREDENQYRVKLMLKDNRIFEYTCNCSLHKTYKGMCCHGVAAGLEYEKRSKEELQPSVFTAVEIRNMIKGYTDIECKEILTQGEENKVNLYTQYTNKENYLTVSFFVGRDRRYMITDLVKFIDAITNGKVEEYGKTLSFCHGEEAFSPVSRPVIRLLQELVTNYTSHYVSANVNTILPKLDHLVLNSVDLDRLMDCQLNQKAEILTRNGVLNKVRIIDKTPEIIVSIRRKGKNGFCISVNRKWSIICGIQYLYLISENHIYRCSMEFSYYMGIFMKNICNSHSDGVDLNSNDMPAFCERVLPKLKRYCQVNAEDFQLSSYKPEELKARFYFDCRNQNEIILNPTFSYGDYYFHPLSKEKFPREVFRDEPGELRISQFIMKYFKCTESDTDYFIIRNKEEEIYHLLEDGMRGFSLLGEVFVTDRLKNLKVLEAPKVTLGVNVTENWLDLKIDAGNLTGAELNHLLKEYQQKKKFYRLEDGSFVKFDNTSFEALAELTKGLKLTKENFENKQVELPKYRAMYLDKVLKESEELAICRDSKFKKIIRDMKSIEDSDYEVPASMKDVLRGYQRTGFRWLKTLDAYGFGGILADDMGLGKTVQMIGLLLDEKNHAKRRQQSLIVCPASLVYNWENECSVFAPALDVLAITGQAGEREQLLSHIDMYDVLITSYDLLKRDIEIYKSMNFRFQIIDEAQYIKNASTQSAKAVKAIGAQTKFALTGTPIENRLSELWSIFDYLMPGFLYNYQKFKSDYELPIVKYQEETAVKRLRRMIGPFLMRRLKQDVLKELPNKLETAVYSKFDSEQQNLYLANAVKLKQQLEGQSEGEYNSKKLTILSELTRLRQICCDPRLCYENYQGGSAKLETCIDLIHNGTEGGHKILLFSQFTSMLALVEERLRAENISYYLLTGATSKEKRMSMVTSFNQDTRSVFLISLKAGGTGLNLTAADIVIHFDPWWNIAAQNQATDRAHRIGQEKVVSVFQLIAKNTIEENIVKLQNSKKNLAEQVITEGSVFLSGLTKEDLIEILS